MENSMEFHGKYHGKNPSNVSEKFHGIPWKISWYSMSMEFSMEFSMNWRNDFRQGYNLDAWQPLSPGISPKDRAARDHIKW
jgi:hypothetical protein